MAAYLFNHLPHLLFPLIMEAIPILVIIAGPLHEKLDSAGDRARIGHRDRGDVDIAVNNAVIDSQGRRNDENPGIVLRQG